MRLPSRVELDRDEVRRGGLYAFLRLAWHIIVPGKPFIGGWHLRLICRVLEAVSAGLLKKVIINIPPGMGKSTLVCVAWPAWDWIAHPERQYLYCSYSQRLSRRDSELTHQLVTSSWYQERWSTRVDHERTETKDDFFTTAGGQRFCTTTDGQATGWHPHVKVADDPNPPKATSGGRGVTKAALAEVVEFWTGTMGSRGEPGEVAEVIIQQRVHEADLSGVLLESGDYLHVRLPMEYEADNPCRTPYGDDPRTVEGELLCEERRGRASVLALKKALRTASNIASQLQQRPQARSGGVFKRKWYKRYRVLPVEAHEHGYWILVWDLNFGIAESPDWVVGEAWCQLASDCYLVAQRRGRWDLHESLEQIRAMATDFPKAITKLVEARANGPAVVQLLEREIVGLVAVNQGNKETRAHSAAAMAEAGNVYVPDGPWGDEWIDEHVGWPHLRHDDQVDTGSHALVHLGDSTVARYGDYVRGLKASGIASR